MRLLTAEELPYDPNQVTPGVIGFTATALVAGAIILLLIHFYRRVSRINDRADARERLLAEVAEAERAAAAASDAQRPDGGDAAEAPAAPEARGHDASGTASGSGGSEPERH